MDEQQHDALMKLYQTHANFVYRIALSYLRNPAEAEDAVADLFLQIMEQDIRFTDETHARAWMVAAIRNRCRNLLKSWIRKRRADAEELPEIADPHDDTELREAIHAVYALPERYRMPLLLFAVQGYSASETAAILKLNESTVRTRIARAREILNKQRKEN